MLMVNKTLVIYCILLEAFQRDDLQRLLMSGRNHHRAGHTLISSVLPCLRADAPPVPRRQAKESVLRHRGDKVISLGARKLQKLPGYQATNGMQTAVIAVCVAAAISKPTSERLD